MLPFAKAAVYNLMPPAMPPVLPWTPTTGLSNTNILNPIAKPTITTKYYITATSAPCRKTDSVTVFVNAAPIANAGANASICFGKSTQLNGSGGVQYAWQPTTSPG